MDESKVAQPQEPEAVARIPFGQDFTPPTLGKVIGHEQVLTWLLQHVVDCGTRRAFSDAVQATCLSHVPKDKDRRDMASHVITAMRAYKLLSLGEADRVELTDIGRTLLAAGSTKKQIVIFARHIVSSCGGQRLIDAIRRYELRGETPDMEDLSVELGEHPTSKSISALRIWLARAGVVTASGPYQLPAGGLDSVIGEGLADLYGLDRVALEFVLAARVEARQTKARVLDAVAVADLAESRSPGIRIKRKSLDRFCKSLEEQGLIKLAARLTGKGGSRTAFELSTRAIHLADEQIRDLLAQSDTGLSLADLLPLEDVVKGLDEGNAERIGRYGEQLAVHLCLMLGLRVRSWRKRAPHAEIDLIAERTAALTYQRWVVQVKNTSGNLDADQVDREVGATAGMNVSHVLFVVPRAEATLPASGEILTRSTLTHLHIYCLTASMLSDRSAEPILRHLRRQAARLEMFKRAEGERREAK
ncbi:MAG TPA: restriction endonuclease [Polyangiaceae bacterium]|nr:restriction endonuclease [Polyangiaceae bacterium]